MTVEGLDLSFDAGRVTPEWCEARLAQGQRVLICDLWTGNRRIPAARDALRLWREAGGITACYFVVHDARPSVEHFTEARAVAGLEWEHLAFVAVDVEVDPTTPQTVREACNFVREEGQRPVVYTSVSKWRELCGNSDALADVPLWDASYGQMPSLDMRPPYGGWTRRAGHQYLGDILLDGIAVDLNVLDEAFVLDVPDPAQDWQTVIEVTRGFGREFSTAWDRMTLRQAVDRMQEAGKQLSDVAGMLEKLRSRA